MKRALLFSCLLLSLALTAAEYTPPPASPSAKLRAWSQLPTSVLVWTNDAAVLRPTNPFSSSDTNLAERMHLGRGDGGSAALFSVASSSDLEKRTAIFAVVTSPDTDIGTDEQALYWNGDSYAVIGETGLYSLQTIGLFGVADAGMTNSLNYGVVGFTAKSDTGQTNVAVAGSSDAASAVAVGGYFEIGNGYNTPSDPAMESAVLLLDNRTNGAPLIVGRTNNGTAVFRVAASGALTTPAVTLAGTTNQVTFGATNSSPASTNVARWISVQVSGLTNAFRLAVYE